ncbi:antitoxin Xre/MbcA/ParS toxin-binding domain-containing protein [Holophaga foetida]|uniref:antitoxin Xre/MbcA/ParS toxin-binding domain-containing protein n=1 Tax=Holophaga foetida TaxID=35839 RepID=UPI0002473AE8|nr:antitoxin Xre/MbcA/ParS toxin-binding domain-containing protein [Holophaga foetida]
MSSVALDTSLIDAQPSDGALLLSAFRKVALALGLTLPEQAAVLGVSRATVAGWKDMPGQDSDKLDRMALFVGIYGLAGEAFPGERGAEGWLRRPNRGQPFRGRSPLELMLEGRFESLFRIYDHLQSLARIW